MHKLIQFKNIVKDFDGQIVLKGVSLDIYENEFVTLLGPSGCGKPPCCGQLTGYWNRYAGFGPITVPVTEQMDIVQLRH